MSGTLEAALLGLLEVSQVVGGPGGQGSKCFKDERLGFSNAAEKKVRKLQNDHRNKDYTNARCFLEISSL